MNRISRYLKISVFFLTIFVISISVSAIDFERKPVKTMQGYTRFSIGTLTEATNWAYVKLTDMTPDAVTFTVTECKGGDDCEYFGTGVVYEKSEDLNKTFVVSYKNAAVMPSGTKVQGRYRNHNWSLNSNYITGFFKYND